MVKEVADPIGYIAIYPDGSTLLNSNHCSTLYYSWGSAVSAVKRGRGRRDYEADRLRIVPVYL